MNQPPEPPPIGASAEADSRAARVRGMLDAVLDARRPATDAELVDLFEAVDAFHRSVLRPTRVLDVACTRGCSNCCSQMVHDVLALEVDRIGRRLLAEGRADEVREALAAREEHFRRVRLEHPRRPAEDDDAWIERVAIAFWSEDRPCALLADDGSCSVHDVRPWSCRRSFAGNDPSLCRGEHARDPRRRFFTVAPYETFDEDLAALDHGAPYDVDTDRLDAGLLRWLESRTT